MVGLPTQACEPWVYTTSWELICIKYSIHLCRCLRVELAQSSMLAGGQQVHVKPTENTLRKLKGRTGQKTQSGNRKGPGKSFQFGKAMVSHLLPGKLTSLGYFKGA